MDSEMTNDHWQKIKQIFNDALELSESDREKFIQKECSGDPTLQKEILSLLEAYNTSEFLDTSPDEILASALSDSPTTDKTGQQVGPFKILDVLDHGGMGSVYLAKRADGQFEQKVALKLLRIGFSSQNQTRRFLAERQILASLNHENIAQLYDGGITSDGQPWFAMEYAEGEPIDKYCDVNNLTIDQRLNLFINICEAVQNAHRQLIVHRDLKPSNILVTQEGKVKLLDFGIAKILNQDELSPDKLPQTRTGLLPLTPAYASPEQVRGETITTASDVYQLGIVLYELLCGCRPYEVTGSTPSEIEEIICEKQPTRPSTAVTNLLQAKGKGSHKIISNRRTTDHHLKKRLRGDLDTIIMKALRKEPERRYESVDQLVTDLRNYLNGLPVMAHADSLTYRTTKFIRRHTTGVAATAAIVTLLIGYAITITWHSQRTQAALEQAQQETAKAEQVTNFLMSLFEANDPMETLGDTVTARELLIKGTRQAKMLNGQPVVQAQMLSVIGTVYHNLGQYQQAKTLHEQALSVREDEFGSDHPEVAKSLHNLARVYKENGDYNRAGQFYRQALEIRKKYLSQDDPLIGESLYHMGMFHQRVTGDLDSAESAYRRSLAIRKNAYGTLHERVAESLRGLGGVFIAEGNYKKAESHYQQAIAIQNSLLGPKHPETLTTLNNLAILKAWNGEYDSATKLLKKSLDQRDDVLGPRHPSIAIQLNNLAFIAGHQKDYEQAEQLLKKALSVMETSVGLDHPHALVFKTNLARIMHLTNRYEKSEQLHRETLQTKQDLLGTDHPDVAASLIQLGALLKDKNEYKEAEELIKEAISIHKNSPENPSPLFISAYYLLAKINITRGNYLAAGDILGKALEIRQQNRPVDHPDIAVAHSLQGACLTDLELYTEAESLISDVQFLLPRIEAAKSSLKQELIKQIIFLYEFLEKPNDAEKYRKLLASTEMQPE